MRDVVRKRVVVAAAAAEAKPPAPKASMMSAHSRPRSAEPPSQEALDARATEAVDEAIGSADAPPPAPRKRARKEVVPVEAPPPYYATTLMRVVYAHATQLCQVLKALGALGNEIMLDFAPDRGLTVHQMHALRTCFVDVRVPVESFLEFDVKRAHSYLLFYEQVKSFAAMANQQHSLSLFEAPDRHRERLCGRLHSKTSDRLLLFTMRDAETADAPLNLPYRDWTYPVRVRMSAAQFADEVRGCIAASASGIEWSIDVATQRLLWRSFSDTAGNNSETIITRITVDTIETTGAKAARQQFSAIYLRTLAAIGATARYVDLYFGDRTRPLRASFAVCDSTAADDDRVVFTIDGIMMPHNLDDDDDDNNDYELTAAAAGSSE